jgi:hypothetical protein
MLAAKNPHPRDQRIEFIQKELQPDGTWKKVHYYVVDGRIHRGGSASAIVKVYYGDKTDYTADYPNKAFHVVNNEKLREYGNMHHFHADRYLNGLPFIQYDFFPQYQSYEELPSWHLFIAYMESQLEEWEVFRTEWPVFSNSIDTTGVIDITLKRRRPSRKTPHIPVLKIVDLKFKQNVYQARCRCGRPNEMDPTKHTADCPFVGTHPLTRWTVNRKYMADQLQVCIYAMIVQDCYVCKVKERELAYLHSEVHRVIMPVKESDHIAVLNDIIETRSAEYKLHTEKQTPHRKTNSPRKPKINVI